MELEKQPKTAKPTRNPIQSRGINTKERILEAAWEIFSEKGYYKTTTNQIARRAQVSIGSLYAYFNDKDTIFLEILERYHAKFNLAKSVVLRDTAFYQADRRAWLRALIEALIKIHEETKALNRELNVLAYYDEHISKILEGYRADNRRAAADYFTAMHSGLPLPDPEATITVVFDLISSTVDRIVFGKNQLDRNRLIDAAVDLISQYFFSERNRKT